MASEFTEEALKELEADAIEAQRKANETRIFVLKSYKCLRGQLLPVEITSIQNLPGHSCLIVNDLLLLSYVEAEQIIRRLNVIPHGDDCDDE